MGKFDNLYDPCESFQAYNRIEARPRQEELDHALRATIHDPLWMLARQYQFGEFKGEDAGSAIFAKVAINKVRQTTFMNKNQELPLPEHIPLETKVEAIMPEIDQKLAYKWGKKFEKILNQKGFEGLPGTLYVENQYHAQLCKRFAFAVEEVVDMDAPGTKAKKIRAKSLSSATAFTRALANRAINGKAIWELTFANPLAILQLVMPNNAQPTNQKFVLGEHTSLLKETTEQWLSEVKQELNIPEDAESDCWNPSKLEYSFNTSVDEGNNTTTHLGAEEYFNGSLDWYAFDVNKEGDAINGPFDPHKKQREVLTVIPSEASFAGMPSSRWWEMEDGTIDLGNLKASDTDIAKIVVAQYALQYSTDWLSIPYDIPSGSLVEVEGIVVTDTFGKKTFVEPASRNNEDWNEWNMYALSVKRGEFENPDFEKRMFLPPAAARVYEGKPVEEVKLIRDEMANMVWGIESVVPDGLGGGINGYETAEKMDALYQSLVPESLPSEEIMLTTSAGSLQNKATTYKPQLKYLLGNSVTENWIPFIASHIAGSNRQINFQRASMPRIIDGIAPHAIRPRTPLLRVGINQDDVQTIPYYIDEEEVPRAGVVIRGKYQRTRWYNGKIVTWYGHRKSTGRGEGSSGLRFDLVLDNK